MTGFEMHSTDTGLEHDDNEPLPTERSRSYMRARRDKARKKLNDALGKIDEAEDFFRMMWAIDKIGEGDLRPLRRFRKQRPEHLEWITKRHSVHKWTLESLLNSYLRTRPLRRRPGRPFRTLDTFNLESPIHLLQLTNELENADDGMVLQRLDVLGEMHRLAQRQFHWQRGKMNKAAFFKSAYLFTFPEADEHFRSKYDISIHDFCFSGFAIAALVQDFPAFLARPAVDGINIDPSILAKGIGMYALPEGPLRHEASTMRQVTNHSAYQASVFRRFPCLAVPEKGIIVCPIRDLVVERFTNGLYYDLVDNDGKLRDLVGKRFESYCRLLFEAFVQNLEVRPEFKYGPKNRYDSPDLFLVDSGETVAVIECKAKKAPISIKLGEEPHLLENPALDELAKGAFQVWRYFSHVRRGICVSTNKLSPQSVGVVVAMDTWMETSTRQREEVLRRARQICVEKDPAISADDQVPVVFANVDDIEDLLRTSTDANLLKTLQEVLKPEKAGWMLAHLHVEIAPGEQIDKGDPLDQHMNDVIQWWSKA